jgi:putative peptidoglycan lipid II flippase
MPDHAGTPASGRRSGGAVAVAAGIFLSRISGLVRERVIAHYLGLAPAADALRAALRIPNLLQNLLGEGVLSASLIPVYRELHTAGRHAEAARVARVVGSLLALVASAIGLAGVLAAEPLVDLLAYGFAPDTRALTVRLVQILFPGTALLVMSAWCLGVLNSHRRFFLPYVAPVLWSVAMITAAIVAGRRLAGHDGDLAEWIAWGAVIGSAAQFLVQLPTVFALLGGLSPSLRVREPGVRETLRRFVPVLIGRGSVQISAYIDQVIASAIGEGIVAAMALAQTLYLLPVSLFGMSISAVELTEMSGTQVEAVRARLAGSLRRVVVLVVPSAVAFATIGAPLVTLIFQTGRFGGDDTHVVHVLLAGSAIGLLPNTVGRLLGSACYALGDTRRPLHASLVRIALGTACGFAVAVPLRDAWGYGPVAAAFGLAASAAVMSWVELALLRRGLAVHIGPPPLPFRLALGALGAAAVAGGLGYATWRAGVGLGLHVIVAALAAIGSYGVTYLAVMLIARVPEIRGIARRLRIVR